MYNIIFEIALDEHTRSNLDTAILLKKILTIHCTLFFDKLLFFMSQSRETSWCKSVFILYLKHFLHTFLYTNVYVINKINGCLYTIREV